MGKRPRGPPLNELTLKRNCDSERWRSCSQPQPRYVVDGREEDGKGFTG